MQPGDNVILKHGEWVDAQDINAKDDLWFRALITADTGVKIISLENGVFIVETVLFQMRYKCWSAALKK